MKQIAPSLYQLDLGIANAYLIRSKEAVILVDAGIQRSLPQIERSLERTRLAWRDLTHLFITHAHPDHVGNFPEIARLSGAETWAHPLEVPTLQGQQQEAPAAANNMRLIDRWLARGAQLLMPGTQATGQAQGRLLPDEHLSHLVLDLRVVHLPGHSAGQVGLYHKGEGWLIGGDVMMNLAGLSFPIAAFTPNPAEAWRSILQVATIQPKILALGHGKPLHNTEEALRRMAQRAQRELKKIQDDQGV